MGGRPAPERRARPQGGADLCHLARRGDTGGMELACRPRHLPATGAAFSANL
jgi:hypothetical protein